MALSLSAAPQEALGADNAGGNAAHPLVASNSRWAGTPRAVPVYTPGEVRHGPDGGDWPTTRFGLPADLTGKPCWTSARGTAFFSFEAERRGSGTSTGRGRLPGTRRQLGRDARLPVSRTSC